jgi:uncharacterized protein YcaQ
LFGDSFIARMDAKAERKQRMLIINNLHFENVELNLEAVKKLAKAIRHYVRFNECDQVSFIRTNNKTMVKKLSVELEDISTVQNPKRRISN